MDWPAVEPPRVAVTNAPSPTVRTKYEAVIEFLKKRVPQKDINWRKIVRTTQESN